MNLLKKIVLALIGLEREVSCNSKCSNINRTFHFVFQYLITYSILTAVIQSMFLSVLLSDQICFEVT